MSGAKISVDARDLHAVLSALNGPTYQVAELQVTRSLGNSPIDRLIDQYNAAAGAPCVEMARVVASHSGVTRGFSDGETIRVIDSGAQMAVEVVNGARLARVSLDPKESAQLGEMLKAAGANPREAKAEIPGKVQIGMQTLGEPYQLVVVVKMGDREDGCEISLDRQVAQTLGAALVPRPTPVPQKGQMSIDIGGPSPV